MYGVVLGKVREDYKRPKKWFLGGFKGFGG